MASPTPARLEPGAGPLQGTQGSSVRLQLALDGPLAESLALLESVHPYVDIIEVGTPLIYREGMAAVRTIRQAYPAVTLTADCKIMDAGREEALIALEAGADVVTVLGVAPDATVWQAAAAANQLSKQVMADMMQVADLAQRGYHLLQMGCHYLCVHTAHDLQGAALPGGGHWQALRDRLPAAPLAVAGGINLGNLHQALSLRPQIVIVGSAITGAAQPAEVARALHARLRGA